MNTKGTCRILYCLDLGRGIDLAGAEERLTSWRRASFHHKSRVLSGDAVLPPLRVRFGTEAPSVDKWSVEPTVELTLYDQGALCVTWSIPFEGPLEALVELSSCLYDNVDLMSRSRALAVDLVSSLGDALNGPRISEHVEDYVIFEVSDLEGDVEELTTTLGGTLARVLRAEQDELSIQETEDALSDRISYRKNEACFIDWLGAFLVGADTEDERLVLELATVELLQLRLLDAQLDLEIGEAYHLMARKRHLLDAITIQRSELQRVGRMQADGAVLHEGIDNALKLLGDDYLARLYRTASDRFHLSDWDASIERKLSFLRSTYESLVGLASHRRSEILEWIIIILIAVDIAIYFTPLR